MSVIAFLLDHGANVHCKDIHRRIALHHAAVNQSEYTIDVMKILVKHKSNVNKRDHSILTLLHLAALEITQWTAYSIF